MQSHRPLSGTSALSGYDRLGSKAAIVRRRQLLRVGPFIIARRYTYSSLGLKGEVDVVPAVASWGKVSSGGRAGSLTRGPISAQRGQPTDRNACFINDFAHDLGRWLLT
jgi:hypothetical protein